MSKVTVFGTGSFGTALANVLAENGHQVLMWGKNETTIKEINEQHINSKYLKTAELNKTIEATLDIETAVAFADIYLMALPTKAMREVAQTIDSLLSSKKTFIHVAKGIENDTYKRVSEMLEDSISPKHNAGIGVLSGPSHAEEVVIKQPTTVAASSKSESVRQLTQDLFMNDYLRVYTNEDLVGVELGGALKNIIAVASGVISGYKLCELKSLDTALNEMNMVVEGVYTTKSVYHLSKEVNVDMPITTALYKVLFENRPVDESVKDLMGRGKKAE